jgi:hypothetical protein
MPFNVPMNPPDRTPPAPDLPPAYDVAIAGPAPVPSPSPPIGSALGMDQPLYAQPAQNPSTVAPTSRQPLPNPQFAEDQQPGLPPAYQGPAQRGGPVKNALMRMLYGMGQAALAHVNLPTDFDIQQANYKQALAAGQLQVQQAHEQLLAQQQQFEHQMVPVTNPLTGETYQIPQKAAPSVQSAIAARQITGEYGLGAAEVKRQYIPIPGVGLFDTQNRQVIQGTTNSVMVTPELVQQYPDLAPALGKPVPLASIQRSFAMQNRLQPTTGTSTDPYGYTTSTTRTPGAAPGARGIPAGPPGAAVPAATPAAPAQGLTGGAAPVTPRQPQPFGGGTRRGQAPELTPAAMDQAAERWYSTGQLPPAVRGAAGLAQNRMIMNRAAELHPQANLAANTAEYKANADSLRKLQTSYDQVSAFENTARKNMDLAQQLTRNIPDLGSRFANIPLRGLSAGMIGSENMARFNTALQTAQTEAAKVLNNPQASGVLSDSARGDLQRIVDGSLPTGSLIGVFDTLRQDMANRNQSYSEQIATIKGRLGQPQAAQGAGGGAGGGPGQVPANVQKILSTAGAGRHTLSDGSVWDKQADGTIVRSK